jgi:hypothetical protein
MKLLTVQPVARPLQSTTQKTEDKHPCLKRDSYQRSQRPRDQGRGPGHFVTCKPNFTFA